MDYIKLMNEGKTDAEIRAILDKELAAKRCEYNKAKQSALEAAKAEAAKKKLEQEEANRKAWLKECRADLVDCILDWLDAAGAISSEEITAEDVEALTAALKKAETELKLMDMFHQVFEN